MSFRRVLLVAVAMLGVLALGAGSAQAGTGLGPLFSLNSSDGLAAPTGVAVDQSNGDVYVSDGANKTLDKFKVVGSKAEQLWQASIPHTSGGEPEQVAVDNYPGPDQGDVFVAVDELSAVYQFSEAGVAEGHATIESRSGDYVHVSGVAVDAAGNIFVSYSEQARYGEYGVGAVVEFNSKWERVNALGQKLTSGEELAASGLVGPVAVAVSSDGEELYVATAKGVLKYTLTLGAYTQDTLFDPGHAVAAGVTIAPSSDLFVEQQNEAGNNEVIDLEPSGNEVMRSAPNLLSEVSFGLSVYGANVYAADFRSDAVEVLGEGATPEVPLTGPVSEVTDTSAVLHGELNPHASAKVGWYFAYNTDGTCRNDGLAPLPLPAEIEGEGVGESVDVSGLKPNTQYTVCAVASGAFGPAYGTPVAFETEPEPVLSEVLGEPASEVKAASAALNGKLNPDGDATYYFEYCSETTTVACSKTAAVSIEGRSLQSVGPVPVGGLLSETTYQYWLLASNGRSTVRSNEETFKTGLQAPSEVSAEAVGVRIRTARLSGALNPGGSARYFFAYCAEAPPETCAKQTPVSGPLSGESPQAAGPAEITGLTPDTTYHYWLVASNAKGTLHSAEGTFQTEPLTVPEVGGDSAANVGSGSVALDAQVDPKESATNYYFEYGTSSAYGSRTAEASVGLGAEAVAAPAHVDGLTPGTEYHFRVVAMNEAGTARGEDMIFRTLPAAVSGLPDERVFERVTPAENENADVYIPHTYGYLLPDSEGVFTTRPFRAAADGDAVAYVADPTSGGNGLGGPGVGNDYMAQRLPGGGWTQVNVQPSGYYQAFYQAFSSDLSAGFVGAQSGAPGESGYEEGLPALSPEAPGEGYKVLYARDSSDGSYQPLFTKTASLKRPATESGYWEAGDPQPFVPLYAGSSADLSESLFESNDALTPNAVLGSKEEDNLYVSMGGQLTLVNVLPDGVPAPNATFGAEQFYMQREFSNVISADGSRVFWTDLSTRDLYVRENATQPQSPIEGERCVVASDACSVLIAEGGVFWTASTDGSKVFFTKGELYEYDLESGQTVDLTPGVNVKGVIGASENGEYVYYVSNRHELELWHDGVSTRIAQLSVQDGLSAGPFEAPADTYSPGDSRAGVGHRTAEVTPDGQSLVFVSNEESLPAVGYPQGYQNNGYFEVYTYDAQSGKLFCVSCNPSGEPPQATAQATRVELTAAYLPTSWSNTYQYRWISEDGSRVFFDSTQSLVPQDTNGKQDVYEWERDGSGSCREADGCIYLLSGGTGGSASWLIDASSNGDDVFIVSRTELVSGDPYDSFDVYDARVHGVPAPVLPACSGTGCQGVPPAPPIFATPASVTFAGVGNFPAASSTAPLPAGKSQPKAKPLTRAQKLAKALRTCRRKRRGRSVCEAQTRRRYATRSRAERSAMQRKGR
jgi:hypothetical protein